MTTLEIISRISGGISIIALAVAGIIAVTMSDTWVEDDLNKKD